MPSKAFASTLLRGLFYLENNWKWWAALNANSPWQLPDWGWTGCISHMCTHVRGEVQAGAQAINTETTLLAFLGYFPPRNRRFPTNSSWTDFQQRWSWKISSKFCSLRWNIWMFSAETSFIWLQRTQTMVPGGSLSWVVENLFQSSISHFLKMLSQIDIHFPDNIEQKKAAVTPALTFRSYPQGK